MFLATKKTPTKKALYIAVKGFFESKYAVLISQYSQEVEPAGQLSNSIYTGFQLLGELAGYIMTSFVSNKTFHKPIDAS